MFRTLFTAACMACIAFTAKGHEFWIDPVAHQVAPGDRVEANLRVGQEYEGSAFAFIPRNIRRFDYAFQGDIRPVEGTVGDRPALALTPEGEGLLVAIHATTDQHITWSEWEKFVSFLEHKDLTWGLAEHDARGLSRENVRERYSRYAKSLIAVGDGAGEVPDLGNVELARISRLNLTAPLPPDGSAITIGWDPSLGPLVVRQAGVEDGYSAYLTPGMVSDPIPREGGSPQTALQAFGDYILVGFDHIVPQGLDHILFVLGLFFFSLRMRALLWQVTAFTLAHTVTLALGALDIIRVSPDIVEPIIAASIVYVGVENLFLQRLPPWRPFVVFGFGLLHGLGFAAVLQDFGLGNDHFVPKLIGFNVGVELGQLAVIATAWIALAFFFGRFGWYHRRIAAPVSVAIAIIAGFWVLERTGTVGTDGPWSLFTSLTEGGFSPFWVTVAALGAAALLTALEMMDVTEDLFREFAGMATSFLMFLGIVATFTSGAWILSGAIMVAWIFALRFQSLGEPESAR